MLPSGGSTFVAAPAYWVRTQAKISFENVRLNMLINREARTLQSQNVSFSQVQIHQSILQDLFPKGRISTRAASDTFLKTYFQKYLEKMHVL